MKDNRFSTLLWASLCVMLLTVAAGDPAAWARAVSPGQSQFTLTNKTTITIPATPTTEVDVTAHSTAVTEDFVFVAGEASGAPLNTTSPDLVVSIVSSDGFLAAINRTSLAVMYSLQTDSHSNTTDAFLSVAATKGEAVGIYADMNELVYTGGYVHGDSDGLSGQEEHRGGMDGVVMGWVQKTGARRWVTQLGTTAQEQVTSVAVEAARGLVWVAGDTTGSLFTQNSEGVTSVFFVGVAWDSGVVRCSRQVVSTDAARALRSTSVTFMANQQYLVVSGQADGSVFGKKVSDSDGFAVSFATSDLSAAGTAVPVWISVTGLQHADGWSAVQPFRTDAVLMTGFMHSPLTTPFGVTFNRKMILQVILDASTGIAQRQTLRGYIGDGEAIGMAGAYVTEQDPSVTTAAYFVGSTMNDVSKFTTQDAIHHLEIEHQVKRDYPASILMRIDFINQKTSWWRQIETEQTVAGRYYDPKDLAYHDATLVEVGEYKDSQNTRKAVYVTQHLLCPPGTKLLGAQDYPEPVCEKCQPGQYQSHADVESCNQCAKGYYSGEGFSECLPCPPGQYQPQVGMSSCLPCEIGTHSPLQASTMCTVCPRGSYANTTGMAACTACTPGTALNVTGGSHPGNCTACSTGYYGDESGMTTCKSSPTGSYVNTTGATQPTMCPPGTASAAVAATDPTTCQLCLPGTFAPVNGSSTCAPCKAGTVQIGTGKDSCTPCPTGHDQSQPGQTQCKLCRIGFAALSEGTAECNACSLGMYTSTTGRSECEICPADHYAATPGTGPKCTKCPKFSSSPAGSKRKKDCRCKNGYYGDNEIGYGCRPCPPNSQCINKDADPQAAAGHYVESTSEIISRRNKTKTTGGGGFKRPFWVDVNVNEAMLSVMSTSDVLSFDQEVYKCAPSSACPGGVATCSEGYTGVSCMYCDDNFYRSSSGTCVSCGDRMPLWANVLLLAVVMSFLSAVFVICVGVVCASDVKNEAKLNKQRNQMAFSQPNRMPMDVNEDSQDSTEMDDVDPIFSNTMASHPQSIRSPSRMSLLRFNRDRADPEVGDIGSAVSQDSGKDSCEESTSSLRKLLSSKFTRSLANVPSSSSQTTALSSLEGLGDASPQARSVRTVEIAETRTESDGSDKGSALWRLMASKSKFTKSLPSVPASPSQDTVLSSLEDPGIMSPNAAAMTPVVSVGMRGGDSQSDGGRGYALWRLLSSKFGRSLASVPSSPSLDPVQSSFGGIGDLPPNVAAMRPVVSVGMRSGIRSGNSVSDDWDSGNSMESSVDDHDTPGGTVVAGPSAPPVEHVRDGSEKPHIQDLKRDATYHHDLQALVRNGEKETLWPLSRLVRLVNTSSVLFQLYVSWPNGIEHLQKTFSVLQVNVDMISGILCSVGDIGYAGKSLVRFGIPMLILISLTVITYTTRAATYLIHRVVVKADQSRARMILQSMNSSLNTLSNHFERVLLACVSSMYVFMHTAVMEHFGCHERSSGRYFLTTVSDVECFVSEGAWANNTALVVVFFVLYSLGIPLLITSILVLTRKRRGHIAVAQRYGFLWGSYKQNEHFFEVWVLLFKFSLGMCIPFVAIGSLDQLVFFSIITFVYFAWFMARTPFKRFVDNILEIMVVGVVEVTAVAGIIFMGSGDGATDKYLDWTLGALVYASYALIMSILVLFLVVNAMLTVYPVTSALLRLGWGHCWAVIKNKPKSGPSQQAEVNEES